jgi:cell division protease FtsH
LGPERKSHVLTQEERKITAYHEAGHALVAAFSPQADPVHKISIIARGRAAGYTLKLPVEDRHLYSRAHFLDELSVMLGGYVVEKIVFGDLTTGASDDLRRATELSRKLVTQYGMSDKIGPVTFGQIEELVFLGRDLMTEREYSEKVAEEIDGEVRRIMSEAQKQAQQIVSVKRKLLNEIADKLISAETIEKEEFDALVAVYQKTNKRKISRK